jgi:hypothetical protein
MRISTAVDLLIMHVANYSVQLSWTGITQHELYYTQDIMPYQLPTSIRAGIRDCADGHTITEMSWPTFLYEKYTANQIISRWVSSKVPFWFRCIILE